MKKQKMYDKIRANAERKYIMRFLELNNIAPENFYENNQPMINHLIEANIMEESAPYNEIKSCIYPYLADRKFLEETANIENMTNEKVYTPEDFPSKKWYNYEIVFMFCYKALYPELTVQKLINKEYIKRWEVDIDRMYEDALVNLKNLVYDCDVYLHPIEDTNVYILQIIGNTPKLGPGMMLSDEFWSELFYKVGGPYYLIPEPKSMEFYIYLKSDEVAMKALELFKQEEIPKSIYFYSDPKTGPALCIDNE